MNRSGLLLALALAPAVAGAQEGAGAVPAAAEGAPPPAEAAPATDLVAAPREAEGRLAHPPPAEMGGAPTRLVGAVGPTLLGGSGEGPLLGVSAGLTLVRERWTIVESLEVARRETLLLVGGGRVFALPGRFHLILAGLGGLHATGDPIAFLPAAGIRAEVGWTTRPTLAWVDYLGLSFTGLSDLVRTENGVGEAVGGFRIGMAVTAGFALGRGR